MEVKVPNAPAAVRAGDLAASICSAFIRSACSAGRKPLSTIFSFVNSTIRSGVTRRVKATE
jgi:hypothetical protein